MSYSVLVLEQCTCSDRVSVHQVHGQSAQLAFENESAGASSKIRACARHTWPMVRVPSRCGKEAYSYLWFLVSHWDRLPDIMIFVQGDAPRHAQDVLSSREAVKALVEGDEPEHHEGLASTELPLTRSQAWCRVASPLSICPFEARHPSRRSSSLNSPPRRSTITLASCTGCSIRASEGAPTNGPLEPEHNLPSEGAPCAPARCTFTSASPPPSSRRRPSRWLRGSKVSSARAKRPTARCPARGLTDGSLP